MYILNFVREFVRKCPKPPNFVRRLKKFLSENVREHKKPQVSTHATNRVVGCFHKKKRLKKSKDVHIYKIKSSNENL